MIFVLLEFSAGMARLRSVAIFLLYFFYNIIMKGGEQLALGLPIEIDCL